MTQRTLVPVYTGYRTHVRDVLLQLPWYSSFREAQEFAEFLDLQKIWEVEIVNGKRIKAELAYTHEVKLV